MPVEVIPDTPLADAITTALQPKLVEVGWSTGGQDDAALAEYIVLMLVNGKSQDEIASDISGELLNLEPDDPAAKDFASWLFTEVDALNAQLNGAAPPQQSAPDSMEISYPSEPAKPGEGPILPPTGPRSMRNPPNARGGRDKRMFGQMTKAMDRPHDVLHRVRGNGGINTHNRAPPSGPRGGMMNRQQGRNVNGRGAQNMAAGMAGAMANMANMANMVGPGGLPAVPGANGMPQWGMMSEQPSSAELMNLLQQQSQMMQQISQQMMTQSQGGYQNNRGGRQHQQRGRDGNWGRGGARGGQHHAQSHHQSQGGKAAAGDGGEDVDMGGAKSESGNPEDQICKYNLKCLNKDCKFVHQSPAAPPGTTIDLQDVCSFGAACKNWKCVGRHPSPAARAAHQSDQDCKFFPNCQNPRCPFKHPSMPLCRNGASCTTPDCKFTHVKTKCKFTPCLNPKCPFIHEDGQQGGFKDKVWTPGSAKEHVSERKFVQDDEGVEMVLPEGDDSMKDEADETIG
ncbi:related to nuclear poly(A)-binding protein [Cephalotrichum gorgonifer]|uniref:Related to nuclear poly(A)-binding protein n=1 Tax=Cephalotrichum gorgonifer TaxID=2041049 RepID=A0AAE8MNU7_9PEZI|nr:related to nuclear poly(A)-binding protein [Cephalotrichum gorgonifer]